jgi:hypothetical protein
MKRQLAKVLKERGSRSAEERAALLVRAGLIPSEQAESVAAKLDRR